MTEYWKSNAMHWCDLCRCWMNDSKAAKFNHERGVKHQENLQRKLREMSRKADAEKSQQEQAVATMDSIEAAARKQCAADQAAAQAQAGKWVWSADSGYYYNAAHRWYYDHKTGWYYGGEPVTWTQTPSIPSAAMFGVAPHEGGDAPQHTAAPAVPPGRTATGSASTSSREQSAASTATAAAAALPGAKLVRKVVALPAHPQAAVGGHQMPVAGRIGGAKGVGSSNAAAADDHKRKREAASSSKNSLDPAEAEALARREAARKRVEARTKADFGLT